MSSHKRARAASSSQAESPKRLKQRDALRLAKDSLPKKRSAFAIFLSEQYEAQKQLLPAGIAGNEIQKTIFKQVSVAWAELGVEGQQPYQRRAREEFERHQAALKDLFQPDAPRVEHGARPTVTIGEFEVRGTYLWQGAAVSAARARHTTLYTEASAFVFNNGAEMEQEVRILRKIWSAEDADDGFRPEVYLHVMQPVLFDNGPLKCIIYETFPRLGDFVKEFGGFKGEKLLAMALQGATALSQLHQVNILHCDVRPHVFFWNPHSNVLKLGRFSNARAERDRPAEEADMVTPYAGGYRCPSIWRCPSTPATRKSEAFAFGLTVLETCAAETVFNDLGEIVSFKSSGIAATKLQDRHPAMKKVSKAVLYVCFHFLPEEPEERLLLQDFLGRRDLHRQLCEQ